MHIGQFGDSFWPVVDGVGRVMYSYAETLTRMGHTVTTIAPRFSKEPLKEGDFVFLTYPGIPIPRAKPYRMGFPQLNMQYRHDVKPLRFDIVHAHSPFMAGMEAYHRAKKQNVPLVATFHSKFYDDFLKVTGSRTAADLARRWVASFFHRCDEVWAVNEGTGQVLREYGYMNEIVIMPNGVAVAEPDMEAVRDAERKWGLDERPTLLFVGQLNWKKNVRLVMEACARLRAAGRNFRLVIAGQGPDERAIHELSAQLHLDRAAVFTGHITDMRLLNGLFAKADVFVFPSLYDSAPMVLREAAAMGTPAVLVRGSEAADVIRDGENGFLCENEVDSLRETLERALDCPHLSQIGQNARVTIPIEWPVILKRVLDRYERLIDRRAGKSNLVF